MQESAQKIKKNQSNLPPFWKTNNILPYDCIFTDVPLWFVKINGALATQIITLPLPPVFKFFIITSHLIAKWVTISATSWNRPKEGCQPCCQWYRRCLVVFFSVCQGVVFSIAFPETNSLKPENEWLENTILLLGWLYFQGLLLLVSGSASICFFWMLKGCLKRDLWRHLQAPVHPLESEGFYE